MNLAGRTVVVTGGARGIGRELTRQLLALGAEVIAVGRDRSHLEALAAEHPNRLTYRVVDLADPSAVDSLLLDLTDRHPEISVVINNAGSQTLTDFFGEDLHSVQHAVRREISINLSAVVALSSGLLPVLRRHPSAAIVNITTGLALAPKRTAPVYCATKAGVRVFTRALRYQCQHAAPHVRAIDAVMSLVDTDMTRGRGGGKISAGEAASQVLAGLRGGSDEIYVGKAKLLRAVMRISPWLGYRILRDS